MDCRGLVVLGAALVAGAIPLLPACKGPDPGEVEFQERPGGAITEPGPGTSTSSASSASSSGAPAAGDEFFKAPFQFRDPQQVANAVAAHGAPAGTTPLQGKDCAACHGPASAGSKWLGGGTVYAAVAGGALPAGDNTKIELVIIGPDKTELAIGSPDADGNFWLEGTFPFPDNSKVAIRRQGQPTKPMFTPLTNEGTGNKGYGCNRTGGCHGDATLRIFAP